jgi:hypothetical protein
MRRTIAIALGVFVLFIIVIAVRACGNSRHKDALREYNRQASNIAIESRQTGEELFRTLEQGGSQSPQALYAQILSYKGTAENQLKQAQKLKPPSELRSAQESLLLSMMLRRDALTKIAEDIKPALGDEGEAADRAITRIAAQNRYFAASDVLYEARVVPAIKAALTDAEISGEIQPSPFMRSVAWLSPQFVAGKLGQQLSAGSDGGGDGQDSNQPTGPGLHGTGLNATSYGNVTLQPGTSNRLTYVAGQAFTVSFTNQGDNDEFNIKVSIKIARQSGQPLTLNKTVPRAAKGEKITVTLPLNRPPPLDTALTITTTVAGVPGEKKKDNNTSSYPSLFVRG